MVREQMTRFSFRFFNQLPHMAIFGILFLVVGYYAPLIYRQYFDKTEYISFVQPVEVEKTRYKPCSTVRLTTRATVVMPLQVHTVYILEKLEDDGTLVRSDALFFDSEFDKMQNGKIAKDFPLPCALVSGKYFYSAVISYTVDKASKTYRWYSDTFEVVQ